MWPSDTLSNHLDCERPCECKLLCRNHHRMRLAPFLTVWQTWQWTERARWRMQQQRRGLFA